MPTKKEPRAALAADALVALMTAAGHLTRDLDTACQEHGITHDQYNVLRILRGVHPEGRARGEVSARLISRAPDVTRMIDRLERRSFVRRGWHAENRRLSIATITDDGLALLEQVDQLIAGVHQRFTDGLSLADLQSLRRICRSMAE